MDQIVIMKQIYEDVIIGNKAACDEGVWKVRDWHSVVVYAELLINIELFSLDLLLCSSRLTKGTNLEDAIIDVGGCKDCAVAVLFDFLEFDVAVFFTTKLLLECHLIVLKVVLLHIIFPIIPHGNSDG